MVFWPAFVKVRPIHSNQSDVGQALNTAPPIVALQNFLVTKNLTFPKILKLVLNLSGLFTHFPSLPVHRVAEIAVNLDNGFHDELAFADYIDTRRILTDVVDHAILILLHFYFLRDIVEID